MLFKRGLAVLGLTSLMAFGLMPGSSTTAHADAKVVAKYVTQRMSNANLTSTQVGTYQKGASVNVRCWVTGQNVRNEAWKWSTLWYRDTSGWYTAAVDLNYDPAKVIPGTSACGATVSGLKTDTWYTITSNNSGRRVDVRGGSNKNGTAIQQYAANTTASQQFRFTSVGGRFYAVESKLAGSNVWDVSKSSGTKVQIWGWGGQKGSTSNQQWLVYSPSGKLADVEFRVRGNTNRCLDVPGASKNNNVQLQIYTCNGTKAQRFALKAVASVVKAGGACNAFSGAKTLGTYTIGNVSLPVCGPRPSWDGDQWAGYRVFAYPKAPGWYPGYQCAELSARFLYHRYGVAGIAANGAQVVDNYQRAYPKKFVKIGNGTKNRAPIAGDVLSLSSSSNFNDYGHVGVVASSSVNSNGNGTIRVAEQNFGSESGKKGYHDYQVTNWRVQFSSMPYIKWLRAI